MSTGKHEPAACSMCSAVAGAAALPVFSDGSFVAFLDRDPAAVGHVVVTTRQHINYIDEVPAAQAHQLLELVQRLSAAVSSVAQDSVGIFLTDGEAEFRAAPHVHVHVFPQRRAAGAPAPTAELARTLREALGRVDLSAPDRPGSPGHRSVFWHDVRTPLALDPD